MKKIVCNKNGAVSRKDFNKLVSAMNVLGQCIYKNPTSGYIVENGEDFVYLDAMATPKEIIEAMQTISPLFGLNIKIQQSAIVKK